MVISGCRNQTKLYEEDDISSRALKQKEFRHAGLGSHSRQKEEPEQRQGGIRQMSPRNSKQTSLI